MIWFIIHSMWKFHPQGARQHFDSSHECWVRQIHPWLQQTLGRVTIVVMNQAAQDIPSSEHALWLARRIRDGRLLLQALMGSGLIVIDEVLLQRAAHMPFADQEKVIQAFLADGAYPPLGIRIGIGGLRWRQNDVDALGRKNAIEGCRELGIAIMNEKARG